MEAVVFPTSRITYFATWKVQNAITLKLTLLVKLSFVSSSIQKIYVSVRLATEGACTHRLALFLLLHFSDMNA